MEKGEIANSEQFHLFPQCSPEAFFFNVLKWVDMEEMVKQILWQAFQTTKLSTCRSKTFRFSAKRRENVEGKLENVHHRPFSPFCYISFGVVVYAGF